MRRFSIFCVLLLQILLFAQPSVSQLDQDRIRKAFADAGILPNEGVFNFGYSVTQPAKHCSTIKYPLDPITFSIAICFDKSSKELDAKLKVGDVDLGQAKGTFDGGALISFDHGKCLNGHHRYYVKENELWLRYSNMMFGKDDNGDFKLRSLPFISSEDSAASMPKPKEDEPKPEPKKNTPKHKPKGNAPKPSKRKGNAPKPKPIASEL
ncbi:hypothetical protein JOM56_009877 [Amanita muscaria]